LRRAASARPSQCALHSSGEFLVEKIPVALTRGCGGGRLGDRPDQFVPNWQSIESVRNDRFRWTPDLPLPVVDVAFAPISVIAPARRLPTGPLTTSNLILDDNEAVIGF